MFFDGLGRVLDVMIVLCVVFVPLGLWKLIEIIVWLCSHMSWV
jgi:uncharacterized membrane protein